MARQFDDVQGLDEEDDEERSLVGRGVKGTYSRYDRGPRLTPRDTTVLLWIGLMYAVRFDQLRWLLFRHSPQADKISAENLSAKMISKERAYKLLNKWIMLGLVEVGNPLEGEKRWIWLTAYGLKVVELDMRYRKLKLDKVIHRYYCNQVRLWVEMKRPADAWESERQLAKTLRRQVSKGEQQGHLMDAVLHAVNGKTTMIEVELRRKNPEALEDILRELAMNSNSIWYFLSQEARPNFETQLAKLDSQVQRNFVVYDLSRVTSELGFGANEYNLI